MIIYIYQYIYIYMHAHINILYTAKLRKRHMQKNCLKSSRYMCKNCRHMYSTTTVLDIYITVHTTPEYNVSHIFAVLQQFRIYIIVHTAPDQDTGPLGYGPVTNWTGAGNTQGILNTEGSAGQPPATHQSQQDSTCNRLHNSQIRLS